MTEGSCRGRGCWWFLSLLSAEESGELVNITFLSICDPEICDFCHTPSVIPTQAIHRITSEHHWDMYLWCFFFFLLLKF